MLSPKIIINLRTRYRPLRTSSMKMYCPAIAIGVMELLVMTTELITRQAVLVKTSMERISGLLEVLTTIGVATMMVVTLTGKTFVTSITR